MDLRKNVLEGLGTVSSGFSRTVNLLLSRGWRVEYLTVSTVPVGESFLGSSHICARNTLEVLEMANVLERVGFIGSGWAYGMTVG